MQRDPGEVERQSRLASRKADRIDDRWEADTLVCGDVFLNRRRQFRSYARAIAKDPDNPEWRHRHAYWLNWFGEELLNLAIHEYRAAIRLDFTPSWIGYAQLGSALATVGRHSEAISVLRQALRLTSGCPQAPGARASIRRSIAYSYYRQGKVRQAKRQIEAALRLLDRSDDPSDRREVLLTDLEDFEAGRDPWAKEPPLGGECPEDMTPSEWLFPSPEMVSAMVVESDERS